MSEGEITVVLQPVGDFLVIPLQGPVHENLVAELSSRLLDYLKNKKPEGVIFDMAGIEVLDHHDFESLKLLVDSATLMGAPVAFSGIRPGLAAGLTMLDVDSSWVKAARTVELAMALFE